MINVLIVRRPCPRPYGGRPFRRQRGPAGPGPGPAMLPARYPAGGGSMRPGPRTRGPGRTDLGRSCLDRPAGVRRRSPRSTRGR
ncbi:hypothetical protein E1266_20365 [Actinomadura sp. 7K534]|nr:hypothetical protein E1266_20365 [Actinomadura sp. 7K534]